MKRTAFFEKHIALDGKMVEFGGWEMPLQFSGILDEHNAVRNDVGIFDVSHMGDLVITGDKASEFLSKVVTANPDKIKKMQAKYTHILDENGHIIDDMIFTKFSETELFCVPNASTTPTVLDWFAKNSIGESIENRSDDLSCIALQGPNARPLLQEIADIDMEKVGFFRTRVMEKVGDKMVKVDKEKRDIRLEDQMIISRTGYTGEIGYELIAPPHIGTWLWDKLFEFGGKYGLKPIGLGARDTLRLEMGYLLSGQDFHMDRTTMESNCEWVIHWDHEFNGKNVLTSQKESGEYDRFVGFQLNGAGIPRTDCKILKDGNEVGVIRSGTMSPTLKKAIGLGYIRPELSEIGTEVTIDIRGREVPAQVVKYPFVESSPV